MPNPFSSWGAQTAVRSAALPGGLAVHSTNDSLLSQILQGVQAGSLAITSYYDSEAVINAAKLRAEQANYPQGAQQGQVQGQVQSPQALDNGTLLMIGAGFLLLMMMQGKKSR